MSLYQALETLEFFPAPFFHWTEEQHSAPNARWRELFGPARSWMELLHPDDLPRWVERLGAADARRFGLVARLRRANDWQLCLLSAEPTENWAPGSWLISATDIEEVVEKVEAEYEQERVALRMTARQWSSFFQESATGKAMIGLQGDFLVVNPELCRLLGYEEDQLLQMPPQQLRHHADFSRIEAVYQALLDGGPPVSGIGMRYLRRDGHVIYVLMAISLVPDSRGQPLYFAVEMQDDTARREAETALEDKVRELAASNQDLARSNSELERFAFIASHDLQEPLRKIRIFAGRLQNEAAKTAMTEAGRDYLGRLNASAVRMQQLIGDLLEFSRLRRPPRFETVDLSTVAHEAAADFDTLIDERGGSIEIGPLPTLEGDPSRLRQLLCNLIGNALKFRGEKAPQVKIWAQKASPGPDFQSVSAPENPLSAVPEPGATPENDWWHLFVQDNGIGFDESELPRLLEVFGRVHAREQYPGTGIGLAICRKVAQEHGGDISARSRPGEGATFIVSLPTLQTLPASPAPHSAAIAP